MASDDVSSKKAAPVTRPASTAGAKRAARSLSRQCRPRLTSRVVLLPLLSRTGSVVAGKVLGDYSDYSYHGRNETECVSSLTAPVPGVAAAAISTLT